MNKNQIIIIWIMITASVYALDWIPSIAYILLVGPAILYHAYTTKPIKTSVDKMEHSESLNKIENDDVTVDREYTERIELEIGGYVELECWKEVPFEEASDKEKTRKPSA